MSMFTDNKIRSVAMLVGLAAIAALLAYTYYAVIQAQYFHTGPVTIQVSGEGEVLARPDIATFSFSVNAEGDDAATAQDRSAEATNEILTYLEEEGIAEEDIRTQSYNLSPRYEWTESICNERGVCPPGERILRGYEVNQTISVKVRETDTAGDLISGVGSRGATNVSNLKFTIDDEDALKMEAREKAIADAKEKARMLAEDLGVRIVRMTGYWEDQGRYPMGYGGAETRERSMSLADDSSISPKVPTGENEISSRVHISYEVR